MNIETLTKANEIRAQINELQKQKNALDRRANRVKEYIDFLKSDTVYTFHDKPLEKVTIKFGMSNPTEYIPADAFNLFEENKEEFLDFLKKCEKNYKKAEHLVKAINELEEEFNTL